jgi:hypothetical protein
MQITMGIMMVMMMIIKNAVFWVVAACRSCVNRRFVGTYRLHLQAAVFSHLLTLVPHRGFFYLEDGGNTFLRNVGSHKIYTAPYPRNGILHSHRCEILKS